MKRLAVVLLASMSASGAVAAPPSAADVIDRAIAVHGGKAALASYPSLEMKGTTESTSGRGAGRRSDVTIRERSDGAYRRESTFEFRGRKVTPVEFFDGTACKRRFGQTWDDLPIDEAKEGVAHRLPFLLPLAEKDPRVEGEGTEADIACWTISVADGRDRATLSFAQDDGRLLGIDYPATSAEGMGTKKDVRRKLVFRDHRKVGVLMLPFDVESFEDGTPDSRLRLDTVRVLDAFAPAWIRVPDATRRFIPPEELSF